MKRAFPFYLMIFPGVLLFLIFRYVPMFGLFIAFKSYTPFRGVWKSEWIGFDNFVRLFSETDFLLLLKNTLYLNLLDVFVGFPFPILLALLLNEVRIKYFKNSMQTILYAPHFLSWVVIVGITMLFLRTQDGGMNVLLNALGFDSMNFLANSESFRFVWLFHNIWQGAGWGAIIYLAAIASIDPALYEAATGGRREQAASNVAYYFAITQDSHCDYVYFAAR